MKREADNGSPLVPLSNFKARVLAATGIGETSYRKIQKEAQEIEEGTATGFLSPRKKINRSKPKSDLPQGEIEAIRSVIHNYCIIEKRQPTLGGNILQKCFLKFTIYLCTQYFQEFITK